MGFQWLEHGARHVLAEARRLPGDRRGQIAIIFALSSMALFSAVGAGVDLSRAYAARQKLSEVATLTCQYASRPSVVQTVVPSFTGQNGTTTYTTAVNGYLNTTLNRQQFGYTQTTATPFTFAVNGAADVSLSASVPTTFMKIARISQVSVGAASHCYDSPATINQTLPSGQSPYLVQEGFEVSSCTGACYTFYSPTGTNTPRSTPLGTFPSSPGYTGSIGRNWYIMGYCVEIDAAGVIKASTAEGTHSAELDCDNGSGNQGNSSISTQVYMPAGNYELRYNYAGRVDYPDYDPTYICGSAASDVSFATSTNSAGGPVANASRSNQINVYLDLNTTGLAPTHTTIDGIQALAGSNLIDVCVYSQNWVERSVRIYVNTPGFYWLSFAADGQNDSYGGQLDNIRLCPETCPNTLQDNYPSAWLPVSGVNKILFADTFELPAYVANYYGIASTNGNMNLSLGTSGALSGWPTQTASGWATAPYNEIFYIMTGSAQGTQSIQLDSTAPGTTNRSFSRPFLLDPGYYRLDYKYVSNATFSGLTGSYCGATPSAANISSLSGSATATIRVLASSQTMSRDTNIVGVFMSHGQLASTPIGGGALNSQTSYTNPNGTTSTTPTVAPNGVNLTTYVATQVNPLLDICGYASSWQSRTAYVNIVKSGQYWLTFAALGTADGVGGTIDDMKLTALGSPSMSSPPSGAVTIPVPNVQPNSQISFSGFYVVANPSTLPAPLQ